MLAVLSMQDAFCQNEAPLYLDPSSPRPVRLAGLPNSCWCYACLQAAFGSLDGIINTISAEHDLQALLTLLRVDGQMVCVGAPENPPKVRVLGVVVDFCCIHGSFGFLHSCRS